jgi:hypothetical protein
MVSIPADAIYLECRKAAAESTTRLIRRTDRVGHSAIEYEYCDAEYEYE